MANLIGKKIKIGELTKETTKKKQKRLTWMDKFILKVKQIKK
jgi:hypothetical protein